MNPARQITLELRRRERRALFRDLTQSALVFLGYCLGFLLFYVLTFAAMAI